MGATKRAFTASVFFVLLGALAACPPPKNGHGGHAAVDPDACGKINTNDIGKKMYAFLQASAELDSATADLDRSLHGACQKMAMDLGVPSRGDTKTICASAAKGLRDNLQVSVHSEKQMVTHYTPPVCETEVDLEAKVVAECDVNVSANVSVQCEGHCGGTCSGACDGTCAGGGGGGQCNGECDGTCNGSCEGSCEGYASVDASAECKASAEIQATTHTTCSEPKVEVVQEDVTVVDDSKFQKAMAAINDGMPTILQAGAKAVLVGKAIVLWGKTLGSLVKSGGEVLSDLGERGACVIGQLGAAFAASADIEARIDVSISVTADVSASAGAQAQ